MASLRDLAGAHGTPLYVYDAPTIAERVATLFGQLGYRPLRVLSSVKASPSVGLAAYLRSLGLGLDACSPGDLRLAELAGYGAPDISYTGFGATDDELVSAAARAGDLVLDDEGEVERVAALGLRRTIGLRVNPAITAGFHDHVQAGAATGKFGIALDRVESVAAAAADAGLEVCGLHAHLGSDVLTSGPHRQLLGILADLAERLPTVRWINIGGGFGTPRGPSDGTYPWHELDAAARARLSMPDGRTLELRLEPGGHLTMDAGIVVGRVVSVKTASGGRPETIVTDCSTNQLVSVLLYDARHDVAVAAAGPPGPSRRYRIAGNLMQAGDVLAGDVELPRVAPGDLLTFSHAGAYAASRAGTFNQRPRAAEVLVDGDDVVVLRRAETVDELFARDPGFSAERPGRR